MAARAAANASRGITLPLPEDIEDRMLVLGGGLPSVRRQNWADILMLVLVIALGTAAIWGTLAGVTNLVVEAAVLGLVAVSFSGVYRRMMSRPDHVRALQSDRMLKIANESLPFLSHGLNPESAGEVCRIVLAESASAAVAITDADTVLGFAGVGEEHHHVGGPIITRATHEALSDDEPRILHTKEEIGCPEPTCRLRAAIVVPLEQRDRPVGTLKFYYTSDKYLNETQLAMAEGLARLLSTQLELAELEYQTDLAREMELKALQAQINPHFLFNTINTIAAFIRTDPIEARRLLRNFGSFYRRTLEQANNLVTVERELEFVRMYLELEQARFGDRLAIEYDVDDEALAQSLPAFMVQPLVENAIGHGMRPDGSTLTVRITGACTGGVLRLAVADDGIGIPPERLAHIFETSASTGLGIALRNVRDRLKGYFGEGGAFTITSDSGVGTTVTLEIAPLAASQVPCAQPAAGSPAGQ
ncbi:MAG: histidine kinase [Coriobacteriia bacterium]|nr:histidine kinase [Coriobacteriia bacterium]